MSPRAESRGTYGAGLDLATRISALVLNLTKNSNLKVGKECRSGLSYGSQWIRIKYGSSEPGIQIRKIHRKDGRVKLYYVYIVECSDSLLYTGITNDISRRLEEHNAGLNKGSFTFKRRPVKLIFCQEFNDVNQAISFEKKIKRWSAKKKRAPANEDELLLKLLAECRNSSHSKNYEKK